MIRLLRYLVLVFLRWMHTPSGRRTVLALMFAVVCVIAFPGCASHRGVTQAAYSCRVWSPFLCETLGICICVDDGGGAGGGESGAR